MSTKFFAIAGLLALTSALPASERATLTERAHGDCWLTNPGTQYYKCFQYDGCFAKDPCDPNSPPPPSTTTPCATSSATPSTIPSSTPTPPKSYEITRPRAYNIYVLSKEQHNVQDKTGHIDLNKPAGSRITTTNALVFDNVPKDAKNCRLMWRTVKPDETNSFRVDGNGQAWTRQLTGFPTGTEKDLVSFDGLKKYQDPNAQWSPLDFTGGENDHSERTAQSLKCAEQIGLEMTGSDGGDEELIRIFMTLGEKNGVYLKYDL
ncbi:hypothetical protein DM02DRAFT_616229 [Periconia macrospinosa]|uniref:Ubiquitin 3 binding protein But2 C-terminal domain-containing protein n=1 Tax=Periconia macrospinosa TaxID=97972 RepID=A0A2V1DL34_9PLEO|nr:hypothetical protein DM02DRAFT_616229 [Periconia macrospinosa]